MAMLGLDENSSASSTTARSTSAPGLAHVTQLSRELEQAEFRFDHFSI